MYDINQECQLTIKVASNEIVTITFEDFDVEPTIMPETTTWPDNCAHDHLSLHDGNSINSPIIKSKLCGDISNVSTMVSTGNVMTLHFSTDGTITRKGFKIRASATRGK